MQGELLHSPVAELSHVELVLGAAIYGVDCAEFLGELSGSAELAHQVAIQLHLVDFAVHIDVVGRIRIGSVEVLMRSRRDAHRRGRSHIQELRFEKE